MTNRVPNLWYTLPPGAPIDVEAHIDGLSGDELRGWVVEAANPDRLVVVCIRINDVFAGKVTACHYHEELALQFGSRGLHNFAFRVPERFFAEREWELEVLLEDGRYLSPRPFTILNPSSARSGSDPEKDHCLLFIHIPKTAGTSLRNALRSERKLSRQLMTYPDAPGFPGELLFYLTESQLDNLELVYGHFGFRLHHFIPRACEYATVLREPMERALSHLLHQRRTAENDHPVMEMAPEIFLSKAADADFDNLMTRLISGETSEILPRGGVNETVLEHAISNLHNWFAYAGLQEEIGSVQRELCNSLGLPHKELKHENARETEESQPMPAAVMDELRKLNEFDIRLYGYVRTNFWESGQVGWTAAKR